MPRDLLRQKLAGLGIRGWLLNDSVKALYDSVPTAVNEDSRARGCQSRAFECVMGVNKQWCPSSNPLGLYLDDPEQVFRVHHDLLDLPI